MWSKSLCLLVWLAAPAATLAAAAEHCCHQHHHRQIQSVDSLMFIAPRHDDQVLRFKSLQADRQFLSISSCRISGFKGVRSRRRRMAFQLFNHDDVSSATQWLARLAVGLSTYAGFVAVCDRPQGKLLVNDQIQVRQSSIPGGGLGLFANTNLPKGLPLGTYPGVVLPIQTNLAKLKQHPECEAYIWRFSDSKYIIDPTNAFGKLDSFCVGGNDGQFLSVWLFQSTFLGSLQQVSTTLCRINEPPKGRDVNVVTEENLGNRSVLFRLERDVMAGEELFIDYGLTYDRSGYASPSVDSRL